MRMCSREWREQMWIDWPSWHVQQIGEYGHWGLPGSGLVGKRSWGLLNLVTGFGKRTITYLVLEEMLVCV
jgi:hypothetical protein